YLLAARPHTARIPPLDLFNFASRPSGRFCSTVARPPALGAWNDEPLFPIWIGPARGPLRSLADVLLILGQFRKDHVPTLAAPQGANHRCGRGKQRDDNRCGEDRGRQFHTRYDEDGQERGDDRGWEEKSEEHGRDRDERLPRLSLH